MSELSKEVLSAIRGCIGETNKPVALHEPYFTGNEWAYVKESIDSGWVSTAGDFGLRLEGALTDLTGAAHAVATVNGTSALHIALKVSGVGPGDEVLMPTLTFVATPNAAAYLGATPHFIDSEERTLGLDPKRLAQYLDEICEIKDGGSVNKITGRHVRALVAVHIFGCPVDLDPLVEVCKRFGITLIEDCAESLGSYYKGTHTGRSGLLSILSFNGNKIVTGGGGGAIITSNDRLAERARHLTTTARVAHPFEVTHDETGYNYRLPAINAALVCGQLESLPEMLEKKRALTARYEEAFAGLGGVRLFKEPDFAKSNYWLNALVLDERCSIERESILKETNEAGIMTRPVWTLMHRLPMYEGSPAMELPVAESLASRIVNIPSSAFL